MKLDVAKGLNFTMHMCDKNYSNFIIFIKCQWPLFTLVVRIPCINNNENV